MLEFLGIIFILFLAIVLHECAHGWVAYKLGDSTAKALGRLTLNPIKHIDMMGTIIVPGVLLLLRFLGQDIFILGWAKPVPINFSNLHNPRRDMIWVALAGPAVNLIMAIIFSRLLMFELFLEFKAIIITAIFINLLLAIFNLIPIPPLDGSRIIMGILPLSLVRLYATVEPYGIIIVAFLLYWGVFESLILPLIKIGGAFLGVDFHGMY